MNRRNFFKLMPLAIFGLGSSLEVLSKSDFLFASNPSVFLGDQPTLNRLAFLETVYPFFSVDTFLEYASGINSRKREWNLIEDMFLNGVEPKLGKHFFRFSLKKRQILLSEFMVDLQATEKSKSVVFDQARIKLIRYANRNTIFPFSAYGYPDKPVLPYMADPSFGEYHVKPGSLKS